MPYYAIGFGTWSMRGYRDATETETETFTKDKGAEALPKDGSTLKVPYMTLDGVSSKVAGPFRKAKQAWAAATSLQAGSSMMADPPFIVKAKHLDLKALARKIDEGNCTDYGGAAGFVMQKEYDTKRALHVIRFVRQYEGELMGTHSHSCPSSRPARRRYLSALRKAEPGTQVPSYSKMLKTR